ncbi:hypothetical protein [Candidatus Poriferisodalis sp.]|uniref:hypothetical protein n=1 Tax=Candidatus Poriferisodalis sp. TaxID=3101277 RepID=UPI003B51F2D6
MVAMLVAAGSLSPVAPAGAQTDGAAVLPPVSYTASDCAGKVPIVVGSDAAAQSDLYSAVTLAGVIETDCIVLAGARDESMPADQRARLDAAAAGGFIVGGTVAVPDAKVAGRDLSRLAGTDRWRTARLVGNQARNLAGDDSSAADASAGAEDPTTDCTGDVPIVAASDDAAQSDLYSAVTLAGVIGTDCIVLAGDRDEPMPAAQRSRLSSAAAGGYVLGGLAAVPDTKITGRDMTRLAGTDRWSTAQLVGNQARAFVSGDGNDGGVTNGLDEGFTSVSVGSGFSCGLRTEGTIDCWGSDWHGQISSVPEGKFTQLDAGITHACALRTNGTIACWGSDLGGNFGLTPRNGQVSDAPAGVFTAISAGGLGACALRVDGSIACWGDDELHDARTPKYHCRPSSCNAVNVHGMDGPSGLGVPSGTFSEVSVGVSYACAIRTAGTIECWGKRSAMPGGGIAFPPPAGEFVSVSAGFRFACGLRSGRAVVCWPGFVERNDQSQGPIGEFENISTISDDVACGIRTDGTLTCWAHPWAFSNGVWHTVGSDSRAVVIDSSVPSGRYSQVSVASSPHVCALNIDGVIECWGANDAYQASPATRIDPASGFVSVGGNCGLRGDGSSACWAVPNHHRQFGWRYFGRSAPGSGFVDLASWCGLRNDGVIHCGYDTVLDGRYQAIDGESSYLNDLCAIEESGEIVCWNHDWEDLEISERWLGKFITIGGDCGLRKDRTIACSPTAEVDHPDHDRYWYWDTSDIPSGKFNDVDAHVKFGCGIRTSGVLACWGYFESNPTNVKNRPPTGTFMQVEVGDGQVCGLRTDGRPVCWDREGIIQSPSGDFTAIDEGGDSCAVRSDTTVVCWGHSGALPPYEFSPRLRDIGESIDR